MKISLHSIAALAVIAISAVTAQAQTAPKILVVDLAKLFDNNWKTLDQKAKIGADQQKAQDQLAQLQKEGTALVDQLKALQDQTKNPVTTPEAKAKVQADSQKLFEEIQKKRNEVTTFTQNTTNTLQQRFQTFKTMLLEEITKAATAVAQKKGATFLLDKSGPTIVGVSNILYSDPSLDITDEVMAELNKDRPAPAAVAAPAAQAQESSDAPKITVPGSK